MSPSATTTTVQIQVDHHSAVHLAAESARTLARRCTLPGARPDQAAVVAAELAANLDKHARDGTLYLQCLPTGDGIEIVAADRGPGIPDLPRSMADGYSTKGTLGVGLGAVSRIADEFTVRTEAGTGTLMSARLGRPDDRDGGAPDAGVICLPAEGETDCGDTWALAEADGVVTALVLDGLGHGTEAAAAAQTARRHFLKDPQQPLPDLLRDMHRALRRTRGAAAGLLRLTPGTAQYCGVGNVRLALVGAQRVHGRTSGQPGIVGFTLPTPYVHSVAVPEDATPVLYSDGIDQRWADCPSPFLLRLPPPLLAAALCKNSRRTRDDATALAVQAPQRVP